MNEQTLSYIISEYAKDPDAPAERIEVLGMTNITNTDFYKKTSRKLTNILNDFDIDIKDFLRGKRKIYYFNDSKDEIITMLKYFDNSIAKKIRLKKKIDYRVIFSNDNPEQQMNEALKFEDALNSFMKKNQYTLLKKYDEYDSTDEFNEDLAVNADRVLTYFLNKSKFDTLGFKYEISDVLFKINDILLDIWNYMLLTNTFDAMDDNEVKENLYDLRDDLEKCLDGYESFFKRSLSYNYH